MTFKEALKKLDIEDYGARIFNSNSHGELFHIIQYISMAEQLKNENGWFREWFTAVVAVAEETSDKPEYVFQHIDTILSDWFNGFDKINNERIFQ